MANNTKNNSITVIKTLNICDETLIKNNQKVKLNICDQKLIKASNTYEKSGVGVWMDGGWKDECKSCFENSLQHSKITIIQKYLRVKLKAILWILGE